jgi:hypothetical protein
VSIATVALSHRTNTTFVEDLVGIKVGHDLDGLVEGEEQILTLKDSRILDNEGKQPKDPPSLSVLMPL